jgi:hypothetical protein
MNRMRWLIFYQFMQKRLIIDHFLGTLDWSTVAFQLTIEL